MGQPLASVAIFADSGMTQHQAEYRHAGAAIARENARLISIASGRDWPRALVESALAQSGAVTLVVAGDAVPDAPRGVEIVNVADMRAAGREAAARAQVLIGLPAGIEVTATLYNAWIDGGGAGGGKPVGLLNHNRAFEVVRGFLTDVAAVGLGGVDHLVQVSDNFDDLWTRLKRLVE